MNKEKLEKLIGYILLVAAQRDPEDRDLGAIHILKYVYIADLEYAKYNNGITYTEIDWQFFKFGPWSNELYRNIEPTIEIFGGEIITIPSKSYDDTKRYRLEDDHLFNKLDRELPTYITSPIQWAVRKFSNDTESLLHYVYLTEPMLNARPGVSLVFLAAPKLLKEEHIQKIEMTPKQEKKWKTAISEAKDKFHKLTEKKLSEEQECQKNIPTLKIDKSYLEALDTFEKMDGPTISESTGTLIFSDDVWQSDWRKDPER
jgi:hypothetical protein